MQPGDRPQSRGLGRLSAAIETHGGERPQHRGFGQEVAPELESHGEAIPRARASSARCARYVGRTGSAQDGQTRREGGEIGRDTVKRAGRGASEPKAPARQTWQRDRRRATRNLEMRLQAAHVKEECST